MSLSYERLGWKELFIVIAVLVQFPQMEPGNSTEREIRRSDNPSLQSRRAGAEVLVSVNLRSNKHITK